MLREGLRLRSTASFYLQYKVLVCCPEVYYKPEVGLEILEYEARVHLQRITNSATTPYPRMDKQSGVDVDHREYSGAV